ncbi:50S ribosomal protein L2 [Akkermansiaceae bacterium]|jgi:large subunit ribosomal protein L2|nr:50S ribosomal protein L2 [Akkermansiaceae bacterium]MBR9758945.1 50S ribosomal protein L2 [bacterium]OUV13015.1 MAG: 50S ribosomal protein L2 [Verrucomicrobiaceae bacterium TMED86]MCH1507847.1 50S ribosomal protein L2 [Akkermansiaceae bacterium]MDB2430143.1 50S ribosomal protein L2 [Akkermansiaceae bacterium]
MPLKSFKPVTPANRYKMLPGFDEITKSKPEKSLLEVKKRSGGRNNQGRITCRHIGGGHKKKYRLVDFKRTKRDQVAEVVGIEYDPNRTCRIALLKYEDGTKSYILAPSGLTDGDKVVSGESVEPKVGNAMPLKNVPLGTAIHNIELRPGSGGKVARSAGQQAILQSREGGYAFIKMPSGELRKFHEESYATIGTVGNRDHMKEISGKAGRTRWQGKRPSVRGMCMNPVDHPNGGGEGKSKSGGGRQHLKSPWGHVKGQKTRKKHNPTDSFIIEDRRKNKRK